MSLLLQLFEQVVEQRDSGVERLAKLLLFVAENPDNTVALKPQFDVVTFHEIDNCVSSLGQKWLIQPKQFAVTHCSSQDAPENVATTLIAGEDSIGCQENQCPAVVGDHPQ